VSSPSRAGLGASLGLCSSEGLGLRPREAAVRLLARAGQGRGIEAAPDRVGDDAVAQAVGSVARGEQAVDRVVVVDRNPRLRKIR
jgi:hypothetical protein